MKKTLILLSSLLIVFFVFNSFGKKLLFQQAKLPVPMVYPKILQDRARIYVLNQGNSEKFKQTLSLQYTAKTDTQIVIYEYNPINGSLKKIADAPFSRSFFGACLNGNKILIAGGYDSDWKATKTFYEYDVLEKKWVRKKDLTIPRAKFALERIGGKVFAFGGENTKMPCEIFSPESNSWAPININMKKPDMNISQAIYYSTTIENRIYLFGTSGAMFYVYSADDNSLSLGLATPFKTQSFNVAPFSKRIYVSCGRTNDTIKGGVYLFDLVENSWSPVGKINNPRYGSGLVFFNGMLLHLGGITANSVPVQPTDEIYVYRPIR